MFHSPKFILFTIVSAFLLLLGTTITPKPANALTLFATGLTPNPIQSCNSDGTVNTTFTWTTAEQAGFAIIDNQYLDLSLQDNGFITGTYLGVQVGSSGPTWPGTYTTSTAPNNIGPLASGQTHYWRVNTHYLNGTWYASTRASFTTITCSGGGGIYPWKLTFTGASGTSVSFHIVPNSGNGSVLILTDLPADANGQGQTIPTNVADFTLTLPTGSHTAVVSYLATQKSNPVNFTVSGVTWNNPGSPPPPFNIMDVFQPAKRFGSFGQLASDVLLILVSLAGALAMIFIMISGFKFVTSSGDEKKLASARATLTYAIIGIAVVILAFVIVQILQYFLQSSVPIT